MPQSNPAAESDLTSAPVPRQVNRGRLTAMILVSVAVVLLALGLINPLTVQIEVAGQPDVTIEVGEDYTDAGARAHVGARHFPQAVADVEVTSEGAVNTDKPGDYTITYSASWGLHSTQTVRHVHVLDSQPPTIELVGESSVTISAGDEFTDPGFTAVDNVDGDIAANVSTSGSVDSATAGTYELTYSVADSSGNSTQAKRTVVVEPKPEPEPDNKVIYLTFDDGPSAHTAALLDVLAAHDVKATFFVTGFGDPNLIGRMSREGHAVGAHTYCHHYRTIYSSEEAFMDDLNQVNDVIEAQTGQRANIMRFAGGSSNTVSRFNPGIMTRLTAGMADAGYVYFDWNVSSGDASGVPLSAAQIEANVKAGVAKHEVSIVLQHDTNPESVAAVDGIIRWGKANGYTFSVLDEQSPQIHHPVAN